MKYCSHVWAGGPNYYLYMLDNAQDEACRSVGSTLAASFENVACWQNVSNLCFFLGITLKNFHLNFCKLAFLCLLSWVSVHSDRFYGFSVIIPRLCKEVYISTFLV